MHFTSGAMGNTIGLKGGTSIVNRTLILSTLSSVEFNLNGTRPPSPLKVHLLVPIPFKPPFPLLVLLELLPPLRQPVVMRRRRKEAEESGEGEVVVAGEEHVSLVRVAGWKGGEEVDDVARVGSPVAVIA